MTTTPRPYQNSKKHKFLRQELRNNSTLAEKILWQYLSKKQVNKFKFRRQHGIGSYILDFYCPIARLGIELDGKVHEDVIRQEYDLEREEYLKEIAKIRIIHFDNEDILYHTEDVIEEIQRQLENRSK